MSPPRTILVVDDDREVQRFLADRLEREGWRVIGEKDGDWALRSFERRRVDAVVLDILIPVVNGFQVAERIRASQHGRNVGIIMLTGIYRGPRHRNEAIERYGLIDYLDKPIDVERLVELLRDHFTRLPQAGVDGAPLSPAPVRVPAPDSPDSVDESQKQERRDVEKASKAVEKPDAAIKELRGNLKRVTFPRLLTKLHRARSSGGLFLLRDKIKKIVYFADGHSTFIKSNVLDECLGRVLVRERMITEAECEESVRRMKTAGRQQGSVLIEMGVISPHNLRFGLELQLQVKLFDIFDWSEGEYVFRTDVPALKDVIGLDMSTAQIVLEGVRRAYHHDRLQAVLQPLYALYLEPAEDPELRFQDLDLSPAERIFLESIDGTRTVADVIAAAPRTIDRHGAMSLCYALHCTGVLAAREAAAKKRPQSYGLLGDAGGGPVGSAERGGGAGLGSALSIDDAKLAGWLSVRRDADAFAVLGLQPSATPDEIELAYGLLARELHADRFRGRPETTVALAREAFALCGAAHATLGDAKKRKALAQQRDRGADPGLASVDVALDEATDPQGATQDPATRALFSDRLFRQGQERLRARAFGDAERLFRQAVQQREDVGAYHAYLGWAVFNVRGFGASAAREALPILERALALAPSDEHPHLFLGMLYAAIDKPELAEPAFEKAIQSNPDSTEALRELRLLHMRRQRPGS